jgi:hypothetical protein
VGLQGFDDVWQLSEWASRELELELNLKVGLFDLAANFRYSQGDQKESEDRIKIEIPR